MSKLNSKGSMRRSSRRETGKNPISAPTNTSRNCKLPSTNSSKKVLNKASAASLSKSNWAAIPNQLALFPGVSPEAKMIFLWLVAQYSHEKIGSQVITDAFLGFQKKRKIQYGLENLVEARLLTATKVGRTVYYEPNPVEKWQPIES